MTRRTITVLLMMFFTMGLWADSAKSANAPTLEDLAKLPVAGPLGFYARGKIERHVDNLVEQIKRAKKVSDIVKARKALSAGYGAHDSPHWQVAYAEISAERIPALFDLADRVKQIQAAMAVAKMPQYAIHQALEKMARHKNPAVRYWAARGYRSSVRKMLLFPERTKEMYVTLERLGRKESGPILAIVLQTLSIHLGSGTEGIVHPRLTLDRVWLARCADLRAGDENVIEAYRRAIAFLVPLKSNKADEKKILQLLVDAMEAASQGFAESSALKKPAGQGWVDLLIELERKSTEVTLTTRTPIQDILADAKKPIVQKAAEIRLQAVLEYWRPMLAKLSVKPRPIPEVTVKPATAPVK